MTKTSHLALVLDDGQHIGAVGGEAEEAVANGVTGGVKGACRL